MWFVHSLFHTAHDRTLLDSKGYRKKGYTPEIFK